MDSITVEKEPVQGSRRILKRICLVFLVLGLSGVGVSGISSTNPQVETNS
jgi:hypothetical protein